MRLRHAMGRAGALCSGTRRTWGVWAMIVIMPIAASLFRVWVYQDTVQKGYALSREEQRRVALTGTLHELEVEQAAARTPTRLMKLGVAMGLQPPRPYQLVGGQVTSHLAQAYAGRARDGSR